MIDKPDHHEVANQPVKKKVKRLKSTRKPPVFAGLPFEIKVKIIGNVMDSMLPYGLGRSPVHYCEEKGNKIVLDCLELVGYNGAIRKAVGRKMVAMAEELMTKRSALFEKWARVLPTHYTGQAKKRVSEWHKIILKELSFLAWKLKRGSDILGAPCPKFAVQKGKKRKMGVLKHEHKI